MEILSFRKTKLSEMDFNNYEMKSYDVGYRYNGERYYVYLSKKDDKFYLIRHLYSSFGSDDILISNEPLSDSLISSLESFEPLEKDIDSY